MRYDRVGICKVPIDRLAILLFLIFPIAASCPENVSVSCDKASCLPYSDLSTTRHFASEVDQCGPLHICGTSTTKNQRRPLLDQILDVHVLGFIDPSLAIAVSDDPNRVSLLSYDLYPGMRMAKVLWSAPKMTQRCQSATDLRLSHKGGTAALAIPRTDVYDSIVTIQLSAQPPGFWVVKEVRAITKDADTSVTALALSHDGSRVAWTDRHRIYIVDTGMPTKRRQILNRDELEVWLPGAVRHLRFHPNANDVLASSHGAYLVEDSADRPGIVVWDTDNGRPLQVLPGLAGGTEFSPDGRLRHSHIMHYVVDRGVPLPIVQKQVGHRSLKTTSVYLSASTEKMAKAYRAARQRAGAETGPRLPGDPSGPVNQCGEPA